MMKAKYKVLSALMAVGMSITSLFSAAPALAADPPPLPPVSGVRNSVRDLGHNPATPNRHEYEVEIAIDTIDIDLLIPQIVMSFDASGSMGDTPPGSGSTRRVIQQEAAKKFLSPSGGIWDPNVNPVAAKTEVAGVKVGMNDNARTVFGWTNNYNVAAGAINGVPASEWTFYPAAIRAMTGMFQQKAASSPADYIKVGIFMTDGKPNIDSVPGHANGADDPGLYMSDLSNLKASIGNELVFHTVAMGLSDSSSLRKLQDMVSHVGTGIAFECPVFTDIDKVLKDILLRSLTVGRKTHIQYIVDNNFVIDSTGATLTNVNGVVTPLTGSEISMSNGGRQIDIKNFPLLPNGTSYVRFRLVCTDDAAAALATLPSGGRGGFDYERAMQYEWPFAEQTNIPHHKHQRTVTYAAGANGSLSGATTEQVEIDSKPANVPTPVANQNYTFKQWELNGAAVDPANTIITGNTTFTAVFNQTPLTVEYVSGPNGSISGITSHQTFFGATLPGTPTTAPDAGYAFDKWQGVDGTEVFPGTTLVNANVATVTAIFAEDDNGDGIPDYKQHKYVVEFETDPTNGAALTGTTQFTYYAGLKTQPAPNVPLSDALGGFTAPDAPVNGEWLFDYWKDLATGATITNLPAHQINSSRTIQAVYKVKQYKVQFTDQMGTTSYGEIYSPKGETLGANPSNDSDIDTISLNKVPQRIGTRRFYGWTCQGRIYTPDQVKAVECTGEMTFKAVYKTAGGR